jgi:hypothetical protein
VRETTQAKKPNHKLLRLEDAVGKQVYDAWISMLKELVPNGRTHRLAVVVASMLQYAVTQDTKNGKPVAELLQEVNEDGEYGNSGEKVVKMVEKLFRDAKVKSKRTSSRGQSYSIIDDAIAEFVAWHNMPWER